MLRLDTAIRKSVVPLYPTLSVMHAKYISCASKFDVLYSPLAHQKRPNNLQERVDTCIFNAGAQKSKTHIYKTLKRGVLGTTHVSGFVNDAQKSWSKR